jgi:molybdopterin/thiamine biosynthesis adenylyltransferase/rhodanese-related sulfurtransferase
VNASTPAAGPGPLVDPSADLTASEVERYSRHIIIPEIGVVGQRRLKNARVLVIGAGGLGSPVLLYLAAAGVGTIGIVDDDVVDLSNLQRQVIHRVSNVGLSKLESASAAVAELNQLVTTRRHDVRLDSTNALAIFADYDLILDGSDNFATRYLVSDAAAILGKPCVWGSIYRFDGQVSVFWEKYGPTYRDLYPEAPPAESVSTCGEGGVFGMLCGVIGATMVSEAVKLITGVGRTLIGRVLVFNALDASWREIAVHKDPTSEPITALDDYEAFCGTSLRRPLAADDNVTSQELAAMLERRGHGQCDFDLIDVRETGEHELVAIPGSRHIPLGRILSGAALPDIPRDREMILYCKAGSRSAEALRALREHGYTGVKHLTGGVLSWISEIEPSAPRY